MTPPHSAAGPNTILDDGRPAGPVVALRGVTKRYRRRLALSGVDLEFGAGEVIGFIGPNGAGKTTLIKVMAGFIRASAGSVRVLGHDLSRTPVSPDGVALVQEHPRFIPYLSSSRNLSLLAGIRHVATRDDRHAALTRVGLDPGDARPVRAYSLGMRQRLGLAQAIMERPRLLLLDEPTNGLDPAGVAELRTLIGDLAAQGTAIFLASHLLTEVERVCNRVLLVRHGQVIKRFDQHRADTAPVQLQVSSPKDMAAVGRWAARTGAVAQVSGTNPLAVRLDTDSPVPALLRDLVGMGVDIERVGRGRRSLEDEFLALVAAEHDEQTQ